MPKKARNFNYQTTGINDRQRHRDYNRRRPESDQFYWSYRWKKFRKSYLQQQPLCVECRRNHRVTAAVIVDHIKPRKDFPELSYELSNLRSLCRRCHNAIGAKSSGPI